MRPRLTLLAFALAACGGQTVADPCPISSEVAGGVDAAEPKVRNVILLIGDGMGPQQMGLLELWARRASTSDVVGDTAIDRLANEGVVGLSMTDPVDGLVVDSACSATQLATGRPALGEVIGLDGVGERVPTILEMAEERGLSTGLVSDTRLTHATPAAFAAHVAHRSMENEIAVQMIASGAEVMLSGGARHFVGAIDTAARVDELGIPFGLSSRRDDERDPIAEAVEAGYALAFDRDQLDAAVAAGGPVLGLFAASGMMDGIQWHRTRGDVVRTEPTLREMTEAALTVLEQDEDGFFLMVEGGQIDWACHDNDAGRTLHEMRKFDDAIAGVLEWAGGRDDTLVVLTADHETGGLGLSYSAYQVPAAVPMSGVGFAARDYEPNFNFGSPEQLDGLHAQSMAIADMLHSVADDPTPEAVMAIVNDHSAFDITLEQAVRVLETEANPYRVDGHHYLDLEVVPRFDDFEAFYPFGMAGVTALVARELANAQNVVWSTGTHTHTPVAVIAWGPATATAAFGGVTHHVEVGQRLIAAFGWD